MTIIIDDFESTPNQTVTALGGSQGATQTDGAPLGGEREFAVVNFFATGSISAGTTGTAFTYSQSSVGSAGGVLRYDGDDNDALSLNATGLGGVDLTDGGALDGISFTIPSASVGFAINIDIRTDGSNSSTANVPIGSSGTSQTYFIPFSSFTAPSGPGADFTNVGAISFDMGNVPGLSFTLDDILSDSQLDATLTDALLIDADSSTNVSVGDTIRYTAVITNPDDAFDAGATGVIFTAPAVTNGTLVVGSVTPSQGTITTGNTAGDTTVAVDIGTILDAGSVTVTYDVLIGAGGQPEISSQGTVTSDGLTAGIVTDDPDDLTGSEDPTVTPVEEPLSLIVTTTADVVDPFDNETSLREAIGFANSNADASTITFASGGGDAFENDALIRLTMGQIEISEALTIDGSSAGGAVVISGDANDDDITVAGTDITDVEASYGGLFGAASDLLNDNSRLFLLNNANADTTFDSLTLTGGRTTSWFQEGGAIYSNHADVTFLNSTVTGNSTLEEDSHGGGISNRSGIVTLTNSTVSENTTAADYVFGGGIYSDSGAVMLTNSTVSGNSTAGFSGTGGGIYSVSGAVTLTNSTVSGNRTEGYSADGGGVSSNSGAVTLTNSTVSGNSTADGFAQGGGIFTDFGTISLTNSLVTGNLSAQSTGDDLDGVTTLLEGNIVGDVFSINGVASGPSVTVAEIFATTQTLTVGPASTTAGVLADNGGPVQTVALLDDPNNPALDVGFNPLALATDANGNDRTIDLAGVGNDGMGFVDAGAVELQAPPVIANLDGDSVNADNGAFVLIDDGRDVSISDADATDALNGLITVTPTSGLVGDFGFIGTGAGTGIGAVGAAGGLSLALDPTIEAGENVALGIGFGAAIRAGTISATDDGQNGTPLTIDLAAPAFAGYANMSLVLQGLTFASTQAGTHTFDVTVTDGNTPVPTTSAPVSFSVVVAPPNQPPSLSLDVVIDELAEDADVSGRIKLADVVVSDDGIGTNDLSLRGADSGSFELDGTELFLREGADLDFEREEELDVFVEVDDATLGEDPDDSETFTLSVTDVNEAPEVAVDNVVNPLAEDLDTSAAVKVADIEVSDDALGSNALSLSGADAGLFSIVGDELFLNAGAALDFESQTSLAVSIDVDDADVGDTPDDSAALVFDIEDVNEAPTVSLANFITGVSETSFLSGRVKVADVVITDDALGTNVLGLAGPNRFLFQLDGNELFVRAGQPLDFETQNPLEVTVTVGDADLSGQVNSVVVTLNLLDVNEAPGGVSVDVPDVELPEDTDTTERVKVADIVITDDGVGENVLSLSGPDAALLEIDGTELFVRAGAALDFESNPDLSATITLDDPNFAGVEGTAEVTIAIGDVNEPPSVALLNPLADLAEDADTSARIKVADIDVSDDALGTNTLALAGADAALFEIDGSELFVIAGAALDFETNPALDVVVTVDDPTLGTDVEDTAALSLAVTDVDEPATLALTPVLTDLAEDADTSARIKVADITITDDALGTNTLVLAGSDAALFEIDGTELFLIAGAALDFETDAQLDVAVTLEGTVESAPLNLAITNVDEPPTLALLNALTDVAEDADTSARIKVADIDVSDDALGTATLGLTGADAALFEIDGAELFLSAGAALDFESAATLEVMVTVDDPALGVDPDDSAPLSLTVSDANEAPTLALIPVLSELGDDADTTARIKVADIAITDDALGTNTLALIGADAALFEIDGNELFLIAGAALTASTLDIAVTLDDPDFAGLEGSEVLALSITQTNAAPSVALSNVIADLDENSDTTAPVFVADITVTDDALGTDTLSLGGTDAALFEITGDQVFLKAGTMLDFETLANLAFDVNVDDATVGVTPDDSASASIAVNDVNEAPAVTLTPVATETLSSKAPAAERQLVATIAITDDVLGTANLALAGADAALFEIDGMELFLKGGLDLQGRIASDLEVEVSVDDPALGAGDTAAFTLPVINVYFTGTPGDDLLIGTQFGDLFEGFAGDDTLVGLGEGDTLDGGAGIDTATLAAPQENHTITFGADGTLVEDRTEAGGSDTLINMEALLFADDRLAAPTAGTPLDLTQFDGVLDVSAAQLAALSLIYIGFYDRAPDAPGLFYWATQLAGGMSLEDIAQEFLDAPELVDVFGETPDAMKLVTTAYSNLLDRDEDDTGSTFWNDLVGDGVIGADEFLFLFAAGTEAGGSDRQILDDQTDVALYFSAIQGLSDTTDATAALAAYDATDRVTSLQTAQTLIDGFVADVEAGGADAELLMRVVGVVDDPFAVA